MTTGAEILNLARKHLSEKYRNVQVPKDDQNWNGPWDCAEFASWLIYQTSGILFGCTDPNARPAKADAYTGAWRTDANKRGRMVSVEEAAATPGAVLLRYPPPGKQMGHIAISDGEGGTVEAMDQRHGVTTGRVSGRRWDTGVLVPGIAYVRNARVVPVKAPSMLYAEDAPNMNPEVVRRIQNALAEKGFPTRDAAGRFAEGTTDAVLDFQADRGIVADGQIGPNTAERLGISLSDVTTPVAAAVLRGVVGTNPLVAVATAIFPAIARVIAGDQSGKVAASAAQAIAEMTGAADPDKARAQIDANPGLQAALQIRLAEIANAQEQSRMTRRPTRGGTIWRRKSSAGTTNCASFRRDWVTWRRRGNSLSTLRVSEAPPRMARHTSLTSSPLDSSPCLQVSFSCLPILNMIQIIRINLTRLFYRSSTSASVR